MTFVLKMGKKVRASKGLNRCTQRAIPPSPPGDLHLKRRALRSRVYLSVPVILEYTHPVTLRKLCTVEGIND